MTTEHAEATLRDYIAKSDKYQHADIDMIDEMEVYLWGKDDSDDYFSKVADDAELIGDFEVFMEANPL